MMFQKIEINFPSGINRICKRRLCASQQGKKKRQETKSGFQALPLLMWK